MGSPDFAIPSLKLLLAQHEVTCVYTAAPKPAKRGLMLTKTPVHEFSESLGISVRTPLNLNNEIICDVDCIVVVAYGLIVPKYVFDLPKYGCLNIHPSLLPRWRGAAPIHNAILSGDRETGVCIMKISEGLDEGDIFLTKKLTIQDDDNIDTLNVKLSKLGAEALMETLDGIDSIEAVPQTNEGVTYANKIRKIQVDWNSSAEVINRMIRAGLSIFISKRKIKILEARVLDLESSYAPGSIINQDMHIQCGEGVLAPKVVQMPGKKPVAIHDFSRGFNISSLI